MERSHFRPMAYIWGLQMTRGVGPVLACRRAEGRSMEFCQREVRGSLRQATVSVAA